MVIKTSVTINSISEEEAILSFAEWMRKGFVALWVSALEN